MSIKGWTKKDYEAAKKRREELRWWLFKNYATATGAAVRDYKHFLDEVNADCVRYEAKIEREREARAARGSK